MNSLPNYTFLEDLNEFPGRAQPLGTNNGNRTQFGSMGMASRTGQYSTGMSTAAPSFNVESTLATATHLNLLGAGNKAYTSLYESYVGLKNRYDLQKELVSELKGDLATLRQQALEPPTRSGRDHSSTDTGSGSRPVTGDFVAVPASPAFEQADYPEVPFWTRKEWDTFVERRKLANKNPPWNAFLTDENGNALSKHRYNELWADAKLAFNSLYYRRCDPTSWSKKTDLAAAYFYNTISAKYPEFRLCDGNWKIHVWTTERYPDWVKNVRKAGGLQRAVPSIITLGQKRPAPTQQKDTKPSKKPRQIKKEEIKQEMPRVQLPASRISVEEPIIIDDDSDEEDSIYVPKSATTSRPQTLLRDHFSPVLESTTSAVTVFPSHQSLTSPMVPAALSVSHPPEHQPATSTKIQPQPSPAIVTTTVLTTQTQENPPDVATPTLAAQLPLPPIQRVSSKPLESIMAREPGAPQPARQIRQKKMNPLSNLMVPEPAIDIPETATQTSLPQTSDAAPVKKGKPLVPSDTLTSARNLYMRDYVKEYPDATLDEFRVDFAKLDSKRRQAYEARSKELKAAAKASSATS